GSEEGIAALSAYGKSGSESGVCSKSCRTLSAAGGNLPVDAEDGRAQRGSTETGAKPPGRRCGRSAGSIRLLHHVAKAWIGRVGTCAVSRSPAAIWRRAKLRCAL